MKTAPKTNRKVFFNAIQKYLSSYILIKLSIPTNLRNKFVSKPLKSKKLSTNEVKPGITLNVKNINTAGSKYNNVLKWKVL